ncbi:MAG: DUF2283 domain-containing protein [Solirubrobacterales bacterium]
MKADYDSEADALWIELIQVDSVAYAEDVDGSNCFVHVADGRPVRVELLSATKSFDLLAVAAQRYDLDAEKLEAAARAALAAPDRVVTLDFSAKQPDSSGRVRVS